VSVTQSQGGSVEVKGYIFDVAVPNCTIFNLYISDHLDLTAIENTYVVYENIVTKLSYWYTQTLIKPMIYRTGKSFRVFFNF